MDHLGLSAQIIKEGVDLLMFFDSQRENEASLRKQGRIDCR